MTQYITADAVDRLFGFTCGAAARGSEIVFTYVNQGIIDGTARSYLDQKMMSAVSQSVTSWIFGLAPSRLAEYLMQRGLELVEDVGEADYRARYLKPRGRELTIIRASEWHLRESWANELLRENPPRDNIFYGYGSQFMP